MDFNIGLILPKACQSCNASKAEEEDGDDPVTAVVGMADEPKVPVLPEVPTLPPGQHMTVMLFGMTGAGKSALGNLVAGQDVFKSADTTRTVTRLDSVLRYEAADGSLVVLDTVGLGDTELGEEQVAKGIRDVCLSAPSGIDMIMYVMKLGRITDQCLARLIYVTQYLWGNESLLNLYIVVTCAPRYLQSQEAGFEWIQTQAEQDKRFSHLFMLVGQNPSRFVFVENPPMDNNSKWALEIEEKRNLSYRSVFQAFCDHPRDLVPPFTQDMMRQVQVAVKEEREELNEKQQEVARIQKELRERPKRTAKASAGKRPGAKAGSESEPISPISPKSSETPKNSGSQGSRRGSQQTVDTKEEDSTAAKKGFRKRMATKELHGALSQATAAVEIAQEKLNGKLEEVKKKEDFDQQADLAAKTAWRDFGQAIEGKPVPPVQLTASQASQPASPPSKGKSGIMNFGKKLFGIGKKDSSGTGILSSGGMRNLMSMSAQNAEKTTQAGKPCLIFDWDDTLCPTWWIRAIMQPSLNRVELSSYSDVLHKQAGTIAECLRAAKALGSVDIVTLANPQWLDQTCKWLQCGGMDLKKVFDELQIQVHYAQIPRPETIPAGADVAVHAKKVCMIKIMDKYYGTNMQAHIHAMSIGDQDAEATALKEVLKDRQKKAWRRPLCKVVRLPEEPMLEDLGKSVQLLAKHLPSLVSRQDDFDITTRSL
eukprot:TRINITY_DN91429_c0_g1_i1.p1 TRINITY_DN91429_c0_g1~~TRINITY_DN91429_c0_g1_i1.p1  ORF type:complete len:709 (-),score=177.19 TRINITY_DN91429_c0_g1_i1:51-2177(-)